MVMTRDETRKQIEYWQRKRNNAHMGSMGHVTASNRLALLKRHMHELTRYDNTTPTTGRLQE